MMKQNLSIQLEQLARAYWQPLVLAVLGLLVFSQLIAWGVSAVELSKVDHLIAVTQDATPTPKEENAAHPDGASPDKPPQSESPDQKKENVPVKNVFQKEEMNFQLTAIYLDKAVINGQVVGVGEAVQKFTVKEIGMNSVLLVDERGNEQRVEMFKDGGGGGAPSSGPSPSNRGPNRSGNRVERRVAGGGSGNPGPPPGGGFPPGFTIHGMSPDQLRNMPQDQRQNFMRSLSESERQQLRERFRGRRQQ